MKRISRIRALYTMHVDLGVIQNATLVLSDEGKIVWVGEESNLDAKWKEIPILDAEQQIVLPGFIDCHTHLVFAGNRVQEFALRATGESYASIMQKGGGIRNSMRALREATVEGLVELALPRLKDMQKRGITSVEVKSGYGLSTKDELKTFEAVSRLQKMQDIELLPTFLGAHTIPPDFENPNDYVDLLINEMLDAIKEQGVARYCDIFIERGAFSVEQARRIFNKASELGFALRVHAEQLSHTGASQLAAEVGALSASHLEHANENDLAALAQAKVVAEILPIAQEFLGLTPLSARRMIDAGLKVAVATDFNPGSSMCNDLHLAARLAVTRCGLSCEEALTAITSSAALSLGRSDIGSLYPGAQADLCMIDCKDVNELLYDWTRNPVVTTMKKGKWI